MLNDIFGSTVYNYQALYTLGIQNYMYTPSTRSIQLLPGHPLDDMTVLPEGLSVSPNIGPLVTRTLGTVTKIARSTSYPVMVSLRILWERPRPATNAAKELQAGLVTLALSKRCFICLCLPPAIALLH